MTIPTENQIARGLGACLLLIALASRVVHAADTSWNVVWDSPSENSRGSMPLGNGDIGANVWVEPSGDLVLLLAKTDAFDEFNRLLKLGRIRIGLTPALKVADGFRWELKLRDGVIEIVGAGTTARVWIDANHPVVQVDVESTSPVEAEIKLEIWRTEPRELNRVVGKLKESQSAAFNAPGLFRVNPDTLLPHAPAELAWCHHNISSPWRANLELTALGDEVAKMTDPVLHRTFGAVVRADGFTARSDTLMKTVKPSKSMSIRIFPLTQIAESPQAWRHAAATQADGISGTTAGRFAAHREWWRTYWERSWITVTGAPDADLVSQAYALQRYVQACGGRGVFPIKFNGTLFTVDEVFDPDYRRWGGGYWWQNTRLIYWSILGSGDYELMRPLFKMYMDALPLRKAATRKYFSHDGAFYPETINLWGNFLEDNYGMNRKGKPDGLADCAYITRYWQGGLELVAMILDYYDMTQDAKFRDETLLPMAKAITTFFDQHWRRGTNGKIFYSPAQSLETWHIAIDPLPEIAGLRYLLPRLLALPADAATQAMWKKLLDDQPEIPSITQDGRTLLLPAVTYTDKHNVENPELYAVFPYRLFTVMQGGAALQDAINTWKVRIERNNTGWQQQPIQAALLGLAEEAATLIVERARDKAVGYRFPGFYGPNYDWTPDQDQISVFQIGLQRMLMQCEGDRILLLPAWPKGWNVRFKLHAAKQTSVECELRDGKVVKLIVTPESRRKDVELCTPLESAK